MKTIVVTNAGRGAAINFCRSLKLADEKFNIIGIDQNKFNLVNAETDKKILCPNEESPDYIPFLVDLIEREKVDLLYASKTNLELLKISENRDLIKAATYLPQKEVVDICEDKYKTYCILREAGIKVPETILIDNEFVLEQFLNSHPEGIWLRSIAGCGGKGSIVAKNFDFAKTWIEHHSGWGRFTAAEVLSKKTATWTAIWQNGQLVVSQARERLYWEHSNLSPSGVTGITGAQKTIKDKLLDEISMSCIRAITDKPHGIISVDYTYDNSGHPYPTEVQASRFFTSTFFMAKAGLNFPYIWTKLASNENIVFSDKFSPLEENLIWIKYTDCLPKLIKQVDLDKIGL